MTAKTVLIVDDDQDLVRALRIRCEALGLYVRTSYDGMEAAYELMVIHDHPPDLIVLDVNLPAENGLTLCEMFCEDSLLVPVPVIILTGRRDPETMRRCEELGAHYLAKGSDSSGLSGTWERLKPIIVELLGLPGHDSSAALFDQDYRATETPPYRAATAEPRPPTALCIDDDRDFCTAMELRLRSRGFHVLSVHNGVMGFWATLREKPDVVIADYCMPKGNGAYVLKKIREHRVTKHIPVVIVTGKQDPTLEKNLRTLGAAGYFTKPLEFDQLFDELARHCQVPLPVG